MKINKTPFFIAITLILNACQPTATEIPETPPDAGPAVSTETQISAAASTSDVEQTATWNVYANSAFGIVFQYPSHWFGPSEYVSDGTLRIEVGSDIVSPYGEPPDPPSNVKNSYYVVIQYTKNIANPYWEDIYRSLQNLQDGESLSDGRSRIIRVGRVDIGMLVGFEYISTLSETAQTEHVYAREVMLYNEHTNDLLVIMGQPHNVEAGNGKEWRDAYKSIDEANLTVFHGIVESITISA